MKSNPLPITVYTATHAEIRLRFSGHYHTEKGESNPYLPNPI